MHLQFLRAISLIFLIFIGVSDPKQFKFVLEKEWLYIIAISILIALIFIDGITGLIFAITLVIIYIKIYDIKMPSVSTSADKKVMLDHITPEDLREAQSNVVSEDAYNTDYKGVKGVYGETVYSAQGVVDEPISAYDATDKEFGVEGL